MGEALLTGSALAAFLAGVVAFFAPCCATVMLPSYLASTASNGGRWRVRGLTAVYIAGVGSVVWPLTIGAAGLASLVNRYHSELFIVGGALMVVVGLATFAGWMWNMPVSSPRPGTDVASVYLMGAFAGAATACCAPVLAGAVVISGLSGSWVAGAVLGGFYLLGLVTPLLLAAAGIGKLGHRLSDRRFSVQVAGRTLRTSLTRLVGGATFVVMGAVAIALGLLGEADTAPAMQESFGRWLERQATLVSNAVPSSAGWALMLALLAAITALLWRGRHAHRQAKEVGP